MRKYLLLVIVLTGCIQPQPQAASRGAFVSPIESVRYRYYVSMLFGAPLPTPVPCWKTQAALDFYTLMSEDPRQQRQLLFCDPRLVEVAERRARAQPLDGLSHCDALGVCANAYAIAGGCRLPSGYGTNGNQLESLMAGTPDAKTAFESLARSPSHSVHIFGEIDFFRAQNRVGIAMVEVPGHRFRYVWAIIVAECVELAQIAPKEIPQ